MNNNSNPSFNLSIRPARPSDAARIVELIHQMGSGSDLTEHYVYHYLSGTSRGVLLAQRGEQVAGLLSYSVRADLYHAGNAVLVEELVVDERYRGEGIGSDLMNALLGRLPGLDCRELSLAVMPDNEEARPPFWKMQGKAFVDNEVVCEAVVTAMVMEEKTETQ